MVWKRRSKKINKLSLKQNSSVFEENFGEFIKIESYVVKQFQLYTCSGFNKIIFQKVWKVVTLLFFPWENGDIRLLEIPHVRLWIESDDYLFLT